MLHSSSGNDKCSSNMRKSIEQWSTIHRFICPRGPVVHVRERARERDPHPDKDALLDQTLLNTLLNSFSTKPGFCVFVFISALTSRAGTQLGQCSHPLHPSAVWLGSPCPATPQVMFDPPGFLLQESCQVSPARIFPSPLAFPLSDSTPTMCHPLHDCESPLIHVCSESSPVLLLLVSKLIMMPLPPPWVSQSSLPCLNRCHGIIFSQHHASWLRTTVPGNYV